MMNENVLLISACLLDIPCQYNGQLAKRRLDPRIFSKISSRLIPVCPEQLGGLTTPRDPAELINGNGFDVLTANAKVVTINGIDVTQQFLSGAEIVKTICRIFNAKMMITQKRSPSCSSNGIYDGSFSHKIIEGFGVCAALLKKNNIELICIDEFENRFNAKI